MCRTHSVCCAACSVDKPQQRRSLTGRQTADLIKQTALPPDQRMRALRELAAKVFASSLLQAWGVSVSQQPLKVSCMPDQLSGCCWQDRPTASTIAVG